MKHEQDTEAAWTIPGSNFDQDSIAQRVEKAATEHRPSLKSALNYLYGSSKTLDRDRLIIAEQYLSPPERRVIRWLHIRTNGSERKMKTILSIILGALAATHLYAGTSSHFPNDRTYILKLVTDEECDKADEGGDTIFNCFRKIDFRTSGNAYVMVTDIMNPATYEIQDNTVVVTMTGPGDAPPTMTFSMDVDHRAMVDVSTLEIWFRAQQ